MEEWTLYIILSSITLVIFAAIGMYWLLLRVRDALIFRPRRDNLSIPNEPYEDLYVGNVMTRWFRRGSSRVMYYLHGNNGSISDRGYVEELTKHLGIDLVLVDYRNYGKSSGVPSIDNMREDSLDVYDVISRKYGQENIIVMSESLGSVPASYISSRRSPSLMLVLSGISRFSVINEAHGPKNAILSSAARVAMRDLDREANADLFSQAKCPILFIHSKSDDLVPYRCAVENNARVPLVFNRGLLEIGGGHASPEITKKAMLRLLREMKMDASLADDLDEWRVKMSKMDKLPDFYIIDT